MDADGLKAQVFDALIDAVLVTDLHGKVILCNRAAEELFGLPAEQMLGHSADEFSNAPAGAVAAEIVLESLQRVGSWSGDVPLPPSQRVGWHDEPHAPGAGPAPAADTAAAQRHRVGSARVFPVFDRAGHRVGHAGVTREVTEQRATAAQLQQAEQRWRSMLDLAPVGLAIGTLEGRFTVVNQALSRLLGYSSEQLTGMTFQEITHRDDLSADLALGNRLLSGEIDHYRMDKRYLHARGHEVWVQLSVTLLYSPSTGRPEQFMAAIEDVTATRQAATRLSSIMASASDALIGIAAAGYVIEWNAAAEYLFGWTRAEALGQQLADLIVPAELRQAHRDGLARLARGEPGRILGKRIEITALTRRGEVFPVELTVWCSDQTSGEFYAFVRDISARARATARQAAVAAAQVAIADVELSPHKVMQVICQHAQELTGADGACVELREGDDMVCRAATGASTHAIGLTLPVAGSLSGLASSQDETLLSHDCDTDPRVHGEGARRAGARSMVVTPLRRGGQTYGVVKVIAGDPYRFSDEDASTLQLLAAPFGSAMGHAREYAATAQEAATDALTGLTNRAYALHELTRALARQQRRGGHTAVAFIDLDRFKPINDTYGHQAGDQLLAAVADRLRTTLRTTDTAARYGGDEFLIIYDGVTDTKDAEHLARRLLDTAVGRYTLTIDLDADLDAGPGMDGGTCAALEDLADSHQDSRRRTVQVEVGASIGIALTDGPPVAPAIAGPDGAAEREAPDHALVRIPSPEALLHAADQAMYSAKQAGGTQYVIRLLG